MLRRSLPDVNVYTSLQPEIRELERRCYYGGRCEAYRVGQIDERCYQMDVRSCYASICLEHELPLEPVAYYPNGMTLELARDGEEFLYAADCVVRTEMPCYPVRYHGRTVYPVGEFFTSLCGEEFEIALQSGAIQKITPRRPVHSHALSGKLRGVVLAGPRHADE